MKLRQLKVPTKIHVHSHSLVDCDWIGPFENHLNFKSYIDSIIVAITVTITCTCTAFVFTVKPTDRWYDFFVNKSR